MTYNYYNNSSRITLLIMCLGPFLSMGIFFIFLGNTLMLCFATVLFFLFFVFLYKTMFIKVTIDEKGILYKSYFKEKFLAWSEVKDVLMVIRERRSMPDFYKFNEWLESGRSGKSNFLLFRSTNEFPANPMFMFSAPFGDNYISIQYRRGIEVEINRYLEHSIAQNRG